MHKVPSHCSFRPDLHELWSPKRAGIKLGIWLPTTNPLKLGVKCSLIGTCYKPLEIFSKVIKYFPHTFKIDLFWESYECPKFWDNKNPREKWHLDVVSVKKHKVYHREGSSASSQKLQVVWSLCLKLSLLSPLHDFHSTCTNHPPFLVVHVDIILNSCLWVRPSPILKL